MNKNTKIVQMSCDKVYQLGIPLQDSLTADGLNVGPSDLSSHWCRNEYVMMLVRN